MCVAAHKDSGLAQGGKFAAIPLDVSDKTQVAGFWDKVPNHLRDIDILGEKLLLFRSRKFMTNFHPLTVNNAGFVLGMDHVGDLKESEVEAMFATNVFGLISVTQLLIKGELTFLFPLWV